MREKQVPFSISDFYTLTVCSCHDVGFFKKFFTRYDFSKIGANEAFEGGYLKVLSSITGYSIFNRFERLKKQTAFWTMMYDMCIVG